jgi:hypothetical protein
VLDPHFVGDAGFGQAHELANGAFGRHERQDGSLATGSVAVPVEYCRSISRAVRQARQ